MLGWVRVGLRFANAAARSAPMHSHEVMKEVLKKTSAKQIASEMGLSLSLIYKWAEQPADESGSGAGNPLDRVGRIDSHFRRCAGGPVGLRAGRRFLHPQPADNCRAPSR
jgi:hypothetical protein